MHKTQKAHWIGRFIVQYNPSSASSQCEHTSWLLCFQLKLQRSQNFSVHFMWLFWKWAQFYVSLGAWQSKNVNHFILLFSHWFSNKTEIGTKSQKRNIWISKIKIIWNNIYTFFISPSSSASSSSFYSSSRRKQSNTTQHHPQGLLLFQHKSWKKTICSKYLFQPMQWNGSNTETQELLSKSGQCYAFWHTSN